MSKILVTFAIGRNTARYDATQSKGARDLAAAIEGEAVELARRSTSVRVGALTKRLKQVVETAYTQAVQYAANRMVGRETRRAWGKDPDPVELRAPDLEGRRGGSARRDLLAEWRPLSWRQIQKQNGGSTAPTGQFFKDEGKLKTELLGMARQMVKNTGVVSVKVKDHTRDKYRNPLRSVKTVPVADLRITLLPRIYPSQLPGLRSGIASDFTSRMSFEKALGLSDEAIMKLRGPVIPGQGDLYHRPLLQPVFTYWTLYQVPGVVAEALNRSLVGQVGVTQTGIADYSSS